MDLTAAQKATLKTLSAAYTKACNTGTGRQAEAAERKLNRYLDSLTRWPMPQTLAQKISDIH